MISYLTTRPHSPMAAIAAACAVLMALGAPAGAAADPAASDEPAPSLEQLSNETTLSRWAYSAAGAAVRAAPRAGSRRVARLRLRTEDGLPEVYLVLARTFDEHGLEWLRLRLPMWPNGRTGWVRRPGLGRLRTVRTQLVIDRRRLRATLYRSGRAVWRSPVGIGAPGTPTPAGRFYVRERLRGLGSPAYGPFAFGTSAYSGLSDWPAGGVIGIHGTNRPELIPGRPSHGCVRVPNPAIRRLARLMPIGTPIRILR